MVSLGQFYAGWALLIIGLIFLLLSKWIAAYLPTWYLNMPTKSKKTGKRTVGNLHAPQTPNEFFGQEKGRKIVLWLGLFSLAIGLVLLVTAYLGIAIG